RYKAELDAEAAQIRDRIAALQAVTLEGSTEALRSAIGKALETLCSPDATIEEKHDAANEIIETCTWDKAQNLLIITYRLIF
ncbi:MAG: hypothetical protein ACRCUT_08610, partial [Spirochaetota bacterium]